VGVLPENWKSYLQAAQRQRDNDSLSRKLRTLRQLRTARIQTGSSELINFANNDYLGLASDLRIAEAAARAAGRYGWGTTASRLVSGNSMLHIKLENETAHFRSTEAALVFGSGYQANLGVLAALAGPGDTILSDAQNHASIVAGCRLSGARVTVYRHADPEDLERALKHAYGNRVVVTDSLFSIRGDTAPLEQIADLCEQYKALLVVDDAHGNAALGEHGRGVPELQGVLSRIGVIIATYSKALASYGGFAACDSLVRDHLINHARPFIYTTSLPVPVMAANIEALRILRTEGSGLRNRLASRVDLVRTRLEAAGFAPSGRHHILAIPVDSPQQALEYAATLEELGLLVYPMRWPSVPRGKDALRVSVSAGHSDEDIGRLVFALRAARDRATGNDTTNLNKRSAQRPSITELAAGFETNTEESVFDQTGMQGTIQSQSEGFGFAGEDSDGPEMELTADDMQDVQPASESDPMPDEPEEPGTASRRKSRDLHRDRDRKRARSRDSA
jgi:8-amino-7-oxononanoate synthase